MFTQKPPPDAEGLQKTLDDLFVQMSHVSPDSEEFAQMADQVSKLYVLKETDSKRRISPDVLATIAANLLGIALIVGHERAHVVTSKAINFLKQLR